MAPFFNLSKQCLDQGMSKDVAHIAWTLEIEVGALDKFVQRVTSALKLYEHTKTMPTADRVGSILAQDWWAMAFRDAAITLFDFRIAINGVKAAVEKTPGLKAMVRLAELNAASGMYLRYWPDFKLIRDAEAHLIDRDGAVVTDGVHIGNSVVISPGVAATVSGAYRRQDDTVSHTINNRTASLQLNSQTVENMENVRRKVVQAFTPASP